MTAASLYKPDEPPKGWTFWTVGGTTPIWGVAKMGYDLCGICTVDLAVVLNNPAKYGTLRTKLGIS